MTLEEKFAEMFPEYTVGSVFLSPYWDLFEAGAEVTEQQLKEEECKLANKLLDSWCRNKDDYCPHLKALEAEIEKMKCCANCKHSEEDNKSSTICDKCFELCYWEMKE